MKAEDKFKYTDMLEGACWEISWPDSSDDIHINYDSGGYEEYASFWVNGKELYEKLKEFYGE